MTPKEKAGILMTKYGRYTHPVSEYNEEVHWNKAKECVLITITEVLIELNFNSFENKKAMDYWESVKQEIDKL